MKQMKYNWSLSLLLMLLVSSNELWAQEKGLSSDAIAKYFQKSFDLESKERYQDAMIVLYPVAKEYPQGYTVNYRLGWLYYLQGKYANALEQYKKSLGVFPNSVEVLNLISLLYSQKEKWEGLEKNARRTLKIDYYNYYGNLHLAKSLYQQGKFEQSLKITTKMLFVFPSATEFLFAEGKAHLALKQFEQARYDLESTRILSPYHTGAINALKQIPNPASKGQ